MSHAYQLKNVRYCYDKTPALSIDQLSIQANKITALIGPNGCGKSTLLNLLAFLQKNQQGQLHFFSKCLTSKKANHFIKRIAFLPQKPYMLRGSVTDNLLKPLHFQNINNNRQEKIQAVLDELGISHLSQQQAKLLSGGEQQKVALARAIITNPEVLLMDEPFSYLDHNGEQLLENFIYRYVKEHNKTLIFSTHNRLQGLAIADDVISLIKGKLVNTPLINLFHGTIKHQLFDTGKIQIVPADHNEDYLHLSIDPNEIVLSKSPMVSSIQNQYQGHVTAIASEMGEIRVSVMAGELFQVIISLSAYTELNISLGEQLWVNFQASSVQMF